MKNGHADDARERRIFALQPRHRAAKSFRGATSINIPGWEQPLHRGRNGYLASLSIFDVRAASCALRSAISCAVWPSPLLSSVGVEEGVTGVPGLKAAAAALNISMLRLAISAKGPPAKAPSMACWNCIWFLRNASMLASR